MPITSPHVKTSPPRAPAVPGLRSYNRLTAADIPAGRRLAGPAGQPGRGRSASGGSRVRSTLLAGTAAATIWAAGVTGAAWPTPASAFCGFFVSGADAQLYNNASQVALLRNG